MTTYGASVRPRPRADGTVAYDVRYRQDGKSKTLSFDIQTGAEKWAGIVRQVGPTEALAFLNLSTKDGTPTVEAYAEKYINSKSGVEPKTLENYRMYMRNHIGPVLGHLPVDAVSSDAVGAWINQQAAAGTAGKTIKNRHGFLSAMFQSAVDDGLMDRNPCGRSKLPETESETEMVFLSPNEFAELVSYIPARQQGLVLFLASTGLRFGEATALRPTDFDLEQRTLRVSRAWKQSRSRGWYIGPPKTRRSKRSVSIPDNLVEVLRPLLAAGNEYVFVNQNGNPVRQQSFYEWAWSPARRLANGMTPFEKSKASPDREWVAKSSGAWVGRQPATIPLGKWPRVHDLRHSHVSWLLAQGVGIDVISRRLGHESITTTVDRYGHIAQERMHGAGDAIGVALAGAMPELSPPLALET